MTNNFLSISSTIPVKAIPWEMFLIWDKKTTKSLQNSIRFSTYVYELLYPLLTCVQTTIVADTRHVNTQSVDVSVSVCVSVDLRNLSIDIAYTPVYITTAPDRSSQPTPKSFSVHGL